jgi:hypothetical protein
MNGYGVMSRRQHPGIPSCTSAASVLQLCIFHNTPISRLGGVALTRYATPLFAVQNLKGEIIQLILSRKGAGMYLVSTTPTKLLIEFL